ncbi:MAG: hypothetical protein P8X90_23135, partial [Desulfobacterales bacterium]
PLAVFADAVGGYIKRIQPDVVITHGSDGEYGHPQHIYTHRATRVALNNGAPGTALLSWSAWYESPARERILNRSDRADIISDVRPWLEAKIAAVLCHKTQHAMFLRNTGAPSVPAMVWHTETFHIWAGSLPAELRP